MPSIGEIEEALTENDQHWALKQMYLGKIIRVYYGNTEHRKTDFRIVSHGAAGHEMLVRRSPSSEEFVPYRRRFPFEESLTNWLNYHRPGDKYEVVEL